MTQTLREYLGFDRAGRQRKMHVTFSLDDTFERDPRLYCPLCESRSVSGLHTHNSDGYDYQCTHCERTYTLDLREDGE